MRAFDLLAVLVLFLVLASNSLPGAEPTRITLAVSAAGLVVVLCSLNAPCFEC